MKQTGGQLLGVMEPRVNEMSNEDLLRRRTSEMHKAIVNDEISRQTSDTFHRRRRDAAENIDHCWLSQGEGLREIVERWTTEKNHLVDLRGELNEEMLTTVSESIEVIEEKQIALTETSEGLDHLPISRIRTTLQLKDISTQGR